MDSGKLAVGALLLGIGLLGLYGAISGRLASMLAAFFAPNILAPATGGSLISGLDQKVGQGAANVYGAISDLAGGFGL